MYQKRVNIMPMAGEGLRFKKAGYNTPKPLINVNGKPMFIRSAECMPTADLWIFITQKKFLENGEIDREIKKNFDNYNIISVDQLTEGQASTCGLAADYLKNDNQVFINACDSFIKFNFENYLRQIKKYDVLVFSTKCKEVHLNNPNAYGWVRENEKGTLEISCKKPFNQKPMNERPIVGTFFFKKSEFFVNSINLLFKNKNKIRNEYYLDMAIQESIKLGFKVGEILVDNYIDLGNYKELEKWNSNNFS